MEIKSAERLKKAIKKILSARTVYEAGAALAQTAVDELGVHGAAVFLIDVEGEHLHGQVGRPAAVWPAIEKVSISLDDRVSAAAKSVRHRVPVAVDNIETSKIAKKWLARLFHAQALLAAPVMTGETPVGCVVAIETAPRHFELFEINDLEFLAGKTGQIIGDLRHGE